MIDKDHLPPGCLLVSCDILGVTCRAWANGSVDQTFTAEGKVAARSLKFQASATKLISEEARNLVIFEGSPSTPATFS